MALKLITPPSALPVTLAEAKAHLLVDLSEDDTLISAYLATATEFAEQMTGRALLTQVWELSLDAFPLNSAGYSAALELTRVPVQSISSIGYTDLAGATQTLASTAYELSTADDFGFATINPSYATEWPSARSNVKVRYSAGYESAATVPESIKSWIKLQVGAMYANREAEQVMRGVVVKLGFVDGLLQRYQVWP